MANETVYNKFKTNSVNGTFDIDTDQVDIALCEGTLAAGAYDPDVADLTTLFAAMVEASGTGYAKKTSVSVTVQQDDTNDRAEVLIAAQTWTGADWGDATALVVIAYVDGTDANDYPISFHDAGFPITTNGGDLTVNFAGAGDNEVLYLT